MYWALRVPDEIAQQGWRWEKLSDYLAGLGEHDYVQMKWPRGGKTVFVHVVSTSIRKLYRCQVIIVRQSLDAPLAQARYWASSDLEADAQTLLAHIAARWDIEVLFGDSKEELGVDHSQLMNATAILRLLSAGAAGLCLPGGRASPPANRVATSRDDWRGATRNPAPPSTQRPGLAS